MNLGKACAIFEQIDSEKFTFEEKVDAIRRVLDMETHNSISKDSILKAFKWVFGNATQGDGWIPCSERLPEEGEYVLLSFENYTLPCIGRYEEDEEGGAYYLGDEEASLSSYGFFVNAWMPLPKPHRGA